MTKKKPDRWERSVHKLPKQYDSTDAEGLCPMTDLDNVVKLLRKEHRARVRMVEKRLPESWGMNAPDAYVNGYQYALFVILEDLKKRAT